MHTITVDPQVLALNHPPSTLLNVADKLARLAYGKTMSDCLGTAQVLQTAVLPVKGVRIEIPRSAWSGAHLMPGPKQKSIMMCIENVVKHINTSRHCEARVVMV